MPDTLSQDEIDALLSAITSEGGTTSGTSGVILPDKKDDSRDKLKKKIKIYDFKRPDKFSKEQIRTVTRIHETFTRFLTTFLSTQLRSIIKIEIVSVDQITYEEFIRSINNPTMMSIFNLGTLEGTGVLEMSLGIVFTILDRLFGGIGKPLEKVRILTEIEEVVMRRILNKIFDLLKESWYQVVEIAPKLELIESNPQFAQIVAPTEMVLLITFEIKIGKDNEGIMNLCFPYVVLEPIVNKLTTQSWFMPMKHDGSSEDIIVLEKKIKNVDIAVIAELGRTKTTFREILNLKIGDLIILDKKIDEPIDVKIGNEIKYKARAGILGKFKAITIEEIIKGDNEEVFKL